MAEPKYRYRVPPCPAYDIPGMESWLEDMAARGLHLAPDGFFTGIVSFEVGVPRRERFRLEATTTKKGLFSEEYDPDDDAIQMHRQMGWVYRARRDQFHIYSTTDPDAPELNTDPQVQAITVAALTKYQRQSFIGTLILMAFYALLYFGDLVISGAILLGTWLAVLFAGLLLWDLGRRLREILVLSRYRKQLQNGEPLPHRVDYRQQRTRYLVGSGVRKVLWAFLLIAVMAALLPRLAEEHYVPLDDQEFPFATLEDLYPGAEVERKNSILESKFASWEDVLAPENYDFTEYAEVTFEGETFDCYLTVHYHRTRYEWTARMLAKEFVSQAGGNPFDQMAEKLFGGDPIIVTELDIPEADYCAYFYKYRGQPWVVLQRDKVVLSLNLDVLGAEASMDVEALASTVLSQLR